jgi:hypothetical protein
VVTIATARDCSPAKPTDTLARRAIDETWSGLGLVIRLRDR